ncbi:MAG: BTAD domain-containing putative transcriptional regulator, partial [Gammaproteobacteria bacterium]
FISRAPPPSGFARLRANAELALMDAEDLQFTEEESMALSRLRYGRQIDKQQQLSIYRLTRGWVAGQILLSEQIKPDGQVPDFFLDSDFQVIFDYFAAEIFDRLAPDLQRFLLTTSLLKKFTPQAAAELSGSQKAEFLLEGLNRRNFFTAKHARPDLMYEYHPLFRTFLTVQLHRTFASEDVIRLKRRASEILARSGHVNEAINLSFEASEWHQAIALILKHAKTYTEQGMGLTLTNWLSAIPAQILNREPWCLYWLGVCRISRDLNSARSYLEQSYALFKNDNDLDGRCLAWSGIVESYAYQWGDFSPLDYWISEMDDLMKRNPRFSSPEIEIKVAAGFFSAMMYRRPEHPDREQWADRLEQYIIGSDDLFLRTQLANHLILYYSWWNLNLTKAATLLKQLETPLQNSEVAPIVRITRHAISAIYHWMAGEPVLCEQNARQGLSIAEETGIQIWNFMLYAQVAWAELTSDDVDGAERTLDIMAGLLDTRRFLDAAHYHYQRFIAAFHKQDYRAMLEHAETALDYSNKAGSPWGIGVTLAAAAQARYASGDRETALVYLSRVEQYGRTFRSSNTLLQALMPEAEIELDQPAEACANLKLKTILGFCKKHGWVNWPWWCRRVVSRLFIRALENGIEVDYVRQLIKKRRFVPETIPVHLENWPWRYRIYTLGRFNLIIDDRPLQSAGKSQKRPLELLRALISLGGRDVNMQRMVDCMWPNAEADAAHASFNMALKRLRTLLGDHRVVTLSEGLLSLDPHYCWVDAWAFERMASNKVVDPEQTEKALALYQGPLFSSEICYGWCLAMRQRLHRTFLATTSSLGRYWEEKEQWQRAVDCYLKGLAVDELAEVFYQRAMLCYLQMGLNNDARRIYEQYLDLVADREGIQPSESSLRIYRSL